MNTYTVRTHAGDTLYIQADSVAQAARKLQEAHPGVTVLSIQPASTQRAEDQQA